METHRQGDRQAAKYWVGQKIHSSFSQLANPIKELAIRANIGQSGQIAPILPPLGTSAPLWFGHTIAEFFPFPDGIWPHSGGGCADSLGAYLCDTVNCWPTLCTA